MKVENYMVQVATKWLEENKVNVMREITEEMELTPESSTAEVKEAIELFLSAMILAD